MQSIISVYLCSIVTELCAAPAALRPSQDLARRRVAEQVALDNRIIIQQNALRKANLEESERQVARMTVMDDELQERG